MGNRILNRRRTSALLVAGLGLGIYFLRPPCLFHWVTGLYCPGCGGTRMVDALLRGDVAAAWGYNPFLMLALPFLLVTMLDQRRNPQRRRVHSGIYLVLCVIAIGFAIWRNLCIL